MANRSRDESYINPVLKYTVFLSNFVVWIVGIGLVGIGTWTFIEKNRFNHNQIDSIYDAIFDISLVIIILGVIIFSLGLAGYIGALRENICLLKFFLIFLVGIFLLLLGSGIAAFLLKDKFITKVTDILQENFIPRYTEDVDTKGLVDWFHEQMQCCGISTNGYKDWNENEYFNCTNSKERKVHTTLECSVPFSCCKHSGGIVNHKCGEGVLALQDLKAGAKIYTRGCIEAIENFIQDNLKLVGGVFLGFTIAILTSVCLVSCLQGQISRQMARW